jgi:4-amino-4-deoxy-L-arabinose transferase-like glycosyltransferase
VVLASMIAVTAVWDVILLASTPSWLPVLRWAILVLGVLAATAVAMGVHQFKKLATVLAAVVVLTLGLGGAAYAVSTAAQPHTGAVPTSGPLTSEMGGRQGGPGVAPSPSSGIGALLTQTTTKWAAATIGSQSASSLELSSGKAVMAIGGWSGGDPAPTLAAFQQYVANKQVHYFIAGRSGGPGSAGANGSTTAITDWVTANFPTITVDGQTVYDLTK